MSRWNTQPSKHPIATIIGAVLGGFFAMFLGWLFLGAMHQLPTSTVATISTPTTTAQPTPTAKPTIAPTVKPTIAPVDNPYWLKIANPNGSVIYTNSNSAQAMELMQGLGQDFSVTPVSIFDLPNTLRTICTVTGSLTIDGVHVYANPASAGALHDAHMLCGN